MRKKCAWCVTRAQYSRLAIDGCICTKLLEKLHTDYVHCPSRCVCLLCRITVLITGKRILIHIQLNELQLSSHFDRPFQKCFAQTEGSRFEKPKFVKTNL